MYVMRFGCGSKTKKKEQATSTAHSRTVVGLSVPHSRKGAAAAVVTYTVVTYTN